MQTSYLKKWYDHGADRLLKAENILEGTIQYPSTGSHTGELRS